MKVCKFGGSSLADANQVRRVCDIIEADSERRIVVVSAPGKRHSDDTKVTDLLIRCANSKLDGGDWEDALNIIVDRYRFIQEDLGLSSDVTESVRSDLLARIESDTDNAGRYLDNIKAAGEDNCARLVAAELNRRAVKARYLNPGDAGLFLSDEFGNAILLEESYANLKKSLVDEENIIIFPGYFGYTKSGHVVTFPRGGSDITASILSAAVVADEYENFTDVDSVFAVDPNIVSDVAPIKELTFREMRELSYSGFTVLHDESIVPAILAGVPIYIKNTNRPNAPGTAILPERKHKSAEITGIASSDGFCTLFVSKHMMNREQGFGRRFLRILDEEGLSYEHIPSGIDNLSVVLRESLLTDATERLIMKRIKSEMKADMVEMEHGLALVMIVGEGMRFSVGLAARATSALASAGVNIEMMNQGSSEISMMFGVKAVDRIKAVRSLYKAFFK